MRLSATNLACCSSMGKNAIADMEHKFNASAYGIDVSMLREYCEREGEVVCYKKGEQMEHEGKPARWFAYVEQGCFKYVTRGISDNRDHITWFSFEGEFVADYPSFLSGRPSHATIEAMVASRVLRVSGVSLLNFYHKNAETMELRSLIAEHILCQFKERYQDLHRTSPRERYELLLRRCPGIVQHLPLNAIASFLNVTPKTISMLRRDITFGA